jgi:hypothetical protein
MNYAEFYYEQIYKGLGVYFGDKLWAGAGEPRDISKEVENISLILRKMYFEMSFLFPDTKRSCNMTIIRLNLVIKKDSFIKTKSFNTDMDKMLARKTHMFEKGDINRNHLILSIVKCLLKVA